MRGTRIMQSAIIAAVAVAGVLAGVTTASATPAGIASAGSATVVRNGHNMPVAPVGPCSLTGPRHGSSNGASKAGIVAFGPATSSCTANTQTHAATSTATGSSFTLSALQNYGGPTIKVASYTVTCSATQSGTNASWRFSGLSGITVPKSIPNGYTVHVKSVTGRLLANVILNEVILPDPNDGSITMNMMHIVLFPNGTPPHTTPMSGDIYVGQTACSPTA